MLDLERIQRLCVVAPHPDDESLGCGGLIALLAARGCQVSVVFVTDGGASHRNSKSWPRERIAAARESEALAALGELGAGKADTLFLRLPDAAMPARGSFDYLKAKEQLARHLTQHAPDLVLLPWRRDPHCDHRDSWILAHEAFQDAAVTPPTLEYAIWLDELGAPQDMPLPAEVGMVSLDISAVRARKRRAVLAHHTQVTDLIDDDPTGFRLTPKTIDRLVAVSEAYLRPLP